MAISRARWAQVGVVGLVAAVISVVPSSGSVATAADPSVRLLTVLHHQDVVLFPRQGDVFLTPGIYLASAHGAFELDAVRTSDGTAEVSQVRRTAGGASKIKTIATDSPVDLTVGLPDFLLVSLRNSSGARQASAKLPFCPGGSFGFDQARTDASGPDNRTYPSGCGSPLTQAAVWGIDQGWALGLDLDLTIPRLRDGEYTLTVSINPSYASQLGVPAQSATSTVGLSITTDSGDCKPGLPPCAAPQLKPVTNADRIRQGEGPALSTAATGGNNGLQNADGTPDMRALPAHDISTEFNSDDGHDYLDFGATIWNAGSGPLVVEGFRTGDTEIMPATQFIYQHGKVVRSVPAGQFEFDTRPGHDHWHMEDIAQYDLLDSSGSRVVLSDKQSFCLAPTDAIDLTGPGADWTPDQQGLWSACQGEEAIWLREVLPAGWGDTYYQSVAGQSFDITGLPNGKYYLRITTDPADRLLETDYTNNSALLAVRLGGSAGSRTVTILG